jgi:alkanesulfonate monooxygenase
MASITVYATAPSSNDCTPAEFRRRLLEVARWAEAARCRGLLVYTDNTLVDPWAAAQTMIANTAELVPMVAVQPVYMHPFSVARMISSIGFLHGRQVDLNLVTGGFNGDLRALGCALEHDERYRRLIEYGRIVTRLLTADRPVTHTGEHYRLVAASVSPPLAAELMPRLFVAGSSPACVAANEDLGAVRLAYPRWIGDYGADALALRGTGIRVGIIARETSEAAWRVANQRFPSDRDGERLHDVAARLVESRWHRRLSADAQRASAPRGAYWLYPFRAYRTFCPYLVGDHEEVGELLSRYLELGVTTLILDVPAELDDLFHAGIAVDLAAQRCRVATGSGPGPGADRERGK